MGLRNSRQGRQGRQGDDSHPGLNFGEVHLKNGIQRIVNGLPGETPPRLGPQMLSCLASLAFLA